MPPMVSYVSLGIDGLSFLATGKSVGDHALSVAMQQDCKVWRLVKERAFNAVCRDSDYAAEILVAMRDSSSGPPPAVEGAPAARTDTPYALALLGLAFETVLPSEPAPAPMIAATVPPRHASNAAQSGVATQSVAGFDDARTEAAADASTAMGPVARESAYLVVGSFHDAERARRLAAMIAMFEPTDVMLTTVGGERFFRVLVGPFAEGDVAAARDRMVEAGYGEAWPIKLCSGVAGAESCDAQVAALPNHHV